MAEAPAWLPDWRDASAYRLERLDRAGFAWEWLRRDPAYCAAARQASGKPRAAHAAEWGLVAFEPPELSAPQARPLWLASVDGSVLMADATAGAAGDFDAFPSKRFDGLLTCIGGECATHWLVSDGWRRVRIDTHCGIEAPLCLRWRLSGLRGAVPQLRALRRLVSVARDGTFSNRLWPPDPQARRWILALRAHDALAANASQRDLAGVLLGGEVRDPGWRIRDPSLRLRAQRLVGCVWRWRGTGFAEHHLSANAQGD